MADINIESEDLDDLPEPPLPAAAPAGELLVIDSDDLLDVEPVSPSPARERGPGGEAAPLPAGTFASQAFGSPVDAAAPGDLAGKPALGFAHVAARGLLSLALAGALGAFVAWAVLEPFTTDRPVALDPVTILLHMAAAFAVLGGLIGAALGSVEGLSAGVVDKALRGLGLGLVIGGAGGALGGLFGQLLYGSLVHGAQEPLFFRIAVRTIAWALVGVFVGLGQGAPGATPRKLINGLLGGLLGGLAGGLLFDPISITVQFFVSSEGAHAGWLSRLVAMVVTGLATGAAIGLVQELRKEAWLIVAAGPLVGKQFILYRPTTTVGSSPKADICLLRDPGLQPLHLTLQQVAAAHLLLASPESLVALNGRPTTRHHLHNGDMIGLGSTVLEYRLKTLPPGA